jgi:pimeloyl-ACP methyl ester carboxylesterase
MNSFRPLSSMVFTALVLGTSQCGQTASSNLSGAASTALALGAQDAEPHRSGPPDRCGPIPSPVEARFDAMRGPLGCGASQFNLNPPGGCAGADAFLSDLRAQYARVWSEADCTANPPSLAPIVDAYDREFAEHHRFVTHAIPRGPWTIAAREFGAEHAGDGPTIVLMHGFPDNQRLYDLVAPALGRTHRTITFDFVGWGASSMPPPDHTYTFDDLRGDLEAVLAYFHVGRVVPVVHDASGWPGIDWALDHPDSVASLVLLNTTYFPVPGQAPPYVIRALAALDLRSQFLAAVGTDELMPRALLRTQVSRFFDDKRRQEVFLPLFERYAKATRPGVFALTATVVTTSRDRVANIPRMRAFTPPVTVAFGGDDPYLNPAVARGLAAVFPGSRIEIVEHAGHYVQLDRPDAVIEAIRASASSK